MAPDTEIEPNRRAPLPSRRCWGGRHGRFANPDPGVNAHGSLAVRDEHFQRPGGPGS